MYSKSVYLIAHKQMVILIKIKKSVLTENNIDWIC